MSQYGGGTSWQEFQKLYKGRGLTREQISAAYQEAKAAGTLPAAVPVYTVRNKRAVREGPRLPSGHMSSRAKATGPLADKMSAYCRAHVTPATCTKPCAWDSRVGCRRSFGKDNLHKMTAMDNVALRAQTAFRSRRAASQAGGYFW